MESTNGWNVGFWGKMNEEMLVSRYPVHRACRDGDHVALSSILLHGKHDNHEELYGEDQFYGWTPAHWAAYYGKLECLQMLVRAGVAVDLTTQRFHQSPSHVAAFGGQPHCVMWLVQNGANVNAQDHMGETPSHKAARSGSMECLGILKANGAKFTVQNNNGHVPKDLAVSCGNESSARYIMQVEQTEEMNGHSQLINGGLCRRKRGNSELDEDDVKKARSDPSMPFGSPITDMNQEFSVPDGLSGGEPCPELLEVCVDPMDTVNDLNQSGLGHLPVPEVTVARQQGHGYQDDAAKMTTTTTTKRQYPPWKYQAFVT